MATYNPPNYMLNDQFIPTFNAINFSEPNSKISGSGTNIGQLDTRYLKKISDDSTPYDLAVSDLTVNGTLNASNASYTQLSATNFSALTSATDTLRSRKLNLGSNNKTYEEYGYNMWNYLDFSDSTNPGFDASGNKRNVSYYSANIQETYNSRTNVCLFTQPVNQTIAYSSALVQRIDYLDYISTIAPKSNISFSFWFYYTVQSGTNCILCIGNRLQINHQFEVWITGGSNNVNARIRLADGSTQWQISTGTLVLNGWNHLAVSMGSAGAKIYLNGSMTNSNPSTYSLSNINATIYPITDFIVGASLANSTYRWTYNGAISDFIVWDEQISDATVLSLYNESWLGYKILVLSGQSNMTGRGLIQTGVDDDYSAVSARVKQFPFVVNMNSDGTPKGTLTISDATNPLDVMSNIPFSGSGGGQLAGTMACWLELCKYILPYLKPREKILLLPCSRGGSGFSSNDWNKGNTLYNAMVNAVNAALAMNSKNKMLAFTWLQGENDSGVPYVYGNYLTSFYNNLLVDMNQFSTAPFIVCEINGISTGKIYINNVLKSITNGENKLFVKASGLTTNVGDTTHFDNVALREIGRRFGYQIANYLVTKSVNPYSINTSGTITSSGLKFSSSLGTLSQYEEGTFQASFVNALVSGTGIYSNNNCSYTRIGRAIYFTVRFNFSRNGNTYSSNDIEIQLGSLPKPTSDRNCHTMGYCVGLSPQIASTNRYFQVMFTQSSNANVKVYRNLELSPVTIKYSEIPSATSTDNCEIQFSGFYFV